MADFPALPIFTDAYMADTLDLNAEQHGAYLLLLMLAWRRPDCAIPNDMVWLKRSMSGMARDMHGNRFNKLIPPLLASYFTLGNDGKLHQKRLRKERDFLEKRSRNARENSKKRWHETSDNKDLTYARAMLASNAPTPTPTPTPISDITKVISSSSSREDENEKPKSRAKPKRRITTDWQPDQSCADACAQRGFNLETERAEFIDYWLSRGDARADWQATFRNWMRTKRPYAGRNQNGSGSSGSGPTSYERAVMAAYEQNIRQPHRSDTDWMRGPDGNPLED